MNPTHYLRTALALINSLGKWPWEKAAVGFRSVSSRRLHSAFDAARLDLTKEGRGGAHQNCPGSESAAQAWIVFCAFSYHIIRELNGHWFSYLIPYNDIFRFTSHP